MRIRQSRLELVRQTQVECNWRSVAGDATPGVSLGRVELPEPGAAQELIRRLVGRRESSMRAENRS